MQNNNCKLSTILIYAWKLTQDDGGCTNYWQPSSSCWSLVRLEVSYLLHTQVISEHFTIQFAKSLQIINVVGHLIS